MEANPFEPWDSNESVSGLMNDLNILIERLQFLLNKSSNNSDDDYSSISHNDEKISSQLQVTQNSMLDLLNQLIYTKEPFTGNNIICLKSEIKKVLFLLTKLPEKKLLAKRLNKLSNKANHIGISHIAVNKYGNYADDPFEITEYDPDSGNDIIPIIKSGIIKHHSSTQSTRLKQSRGEEDDNMSQVLLSISTDVELGKSSVRKRYTVRDILSQNKKIVFFTIAVIVSITVGVAVGVSIGIN